MLRPMIQCLAGLTGAAGVAFAAYASHGSADFRLAAPAAAILLVHGPALLALSQPTQQRARTKGAIALAMAFGVALFAGNLAWQVFFGGRLFEGAAPIGGGAIILAWLALAVEALVPRRY